MAIRIKWNLIFRHGLVMILFICVSLAFFYPLLQGKEVYQSDIVQFKGMSRQIDEQRKLGNEPYWLDNAFVGMPAYQVSAQYPYDYIKSLDRLLRFLPTPASYLFLYLVGMYIFLLILKVDFRLAILGALAFGFSTYLIIILGVGHNAKAHVIAFMPLVLSAIILSFRGLYIIGFLLMTLSMGLTLTANHLQMTYYLLLLVSIMGITYLVKTIRARDWNSFFKSVASLFAGVILAVGLNATHLMATQEYAALSTRGKSDLTINPDGSPKERSGHMSKEYITEYSYGLLESFNLVVPRFVGGSNSDKLPKNSRFISYLQTLDPQQAAIVQNYAQTYWGNQPIVAAPAYLGAVVVFLFVTALFLLRGPIKWWLLGGTLMALILSWGKNIGFLTDFLIEYLPLYDRFRAISSIQVVLELCIPVLAVLGLQELLFGTTEIQKKIKAVYSSLAIFGIFFGAFILFGTSLLSFTSSDELFKDYPELLKPLIEDRKSIFISDLWRSLLFIIAAAGVLWFALRKNLNHSWVIVALTVLILADLIGLDINYVNENNFVSARTWNKPFVENNADQLIRKDTGYFRVFEPDLRMSNARTAYFHHAIGGYHAAKPMRMQEIYDFHLAERVNGSVLNMLNARYIIQRTEDGQYSAASNPYANGNAWWIEELVPVQSADQEIRILDSLPNKIKASVEQALLSGSEKLLFEKDSLATIELVSYKPNELIYHSKSKHAGFVVFSEAYYPHGWNSYMDDKAVDHLRVNYMLRGMWVPAGNHTIKFAFQPKIVRLGSSISLIMALALLGFIGWFGVSRYRKLKPT